MKYSIINCESIENLISITSSVLVELWLWINISIFIFFIQNSSFFLHKKTLLDWKLFKYFFCWLMILSNSYIICLRWFISTIQGKNIEFTQHKQLFVVSFFIVSEKQSEYVKPLKSIIIFADNINITVCYLLKRELSTSKQN